MHVGITQPAFVLRKRPYQETSEIVELFTPEYGRVSCMVKGAKRKRIGGTLAQRLQLFSPLVVRFQGKTDLKTLSEVDNLQAPHMLAGESYYAAHYSNELLLRVLQQQQAQTELFAHYAKLLSTLSTGCSPRAPIRRFEWSVLQSLGAEPDMRYDAVGSALNANKCYYFDADSGWREVSENAVPEKVAGGLVLALASGNDELWGSRFARTLCERLLAPYIGDAPFKSRQLWQQQVQQQQ
jgi:DNA repair protein RecO (recombination protein O)